MKTALSNLWKRRSFRLLLAATMLCALPLLHPYYRQSIFGPTIHGTPWCEWEHVVRQHADPDRQKSWLQKTLAKFGLVNREVQWLDLSSTETLPLFLHLADDGDVKVRQYVLHKLANWGAKSESARVELGPTSPEWIWIAQGHGEFLPEVLLVLRRHVQDNDPQCQLSAAWGVWMVTGELELRNVLLPLSKHTDEKIHDIAKQILGEMALRERSSKD